jgi:hypothetical protein
MNNPNPPNPNPSNQNWPELLAGYVLGDLSSEDMVQVQAYLTANPDQLAEVEALQHTLTLLPLGLPDIAPPPQLKAQILAAIPTPAVQNVLDPRPIEPAMATNPAPPSNVIPLTPQRSRSLPQWIPIAGGLAAAAIAALGLQSAQLHQQIAAARQEIDQLRQTQQQLLAQSPTPNRYQETVSLMKEPGSRALTLVGSGNLAPTIGKIVIVPQQNRAVLAAEKMPAPPPGKVYHLWAVVNGQKVACIQFVPEADGQVMMQIPANRWSQATEVAITLEPEQSDSQPTGEMVMSGSSI